MSTNCLLAFAACFPQGHLDSLRKSILFQHKLRNSRALIVDLHKCSQMSQSKHRAQRQPCPDSCRCINKIHAAVEESIKQRRIKPAQIDRRTDKKTLEF